ncbi:MAG TPA: DUF4010 domain-containing protein [Candidatus Binatus sp.]|nr:DUF4010 domain-containing protein [Candidatus Binatus sp.]
MVAALAGLTDVDAITLSMAEYARSGDPHVATSAIVLATLSNTAVTCGDGGDARERRAQAADAGGDGRRPAGRVTEPRCGNGVKGQDE